MATTLPATLVAAAEGHDESDTQRRRRLRIVVAASLLGTTVEWYDFFLYATAAGLVFHQEIVCEPRSRRNTVLGLLSRWAEGSAFNTWGVFAISYATGALGLHRVSVLVVVTIAAVLMAVLLPISRALADRFGARRVYVAGVACYGVAAFPAFALFGTKNLIWFGLAMIIVFGVVHALFYGAQGTLYSALYPTGTRYTGLSFVYQFSGVYASGITPMVLTALVAAAGGTPWVACGYLVATAVISVLATALIREQDLHL
jgi:MFS family permease